MPEKIYYNRYDVFIILLISSLAFGNVGGSLQMSRLLSILFIPVFIKDYLSSAYFVQKYFIFCAVLIAYGALSFLWSFDARRGFEELVYYFVHLFLFLEIMCFSTKAYNPANAISLGWTISVALTLLVAIWEITTDNHLAYSKQQSNEMMNVGGVAVVRKFASVTFYNYNSYVTFLCLSMPFLFYRMKEFAMDNKRKIVILCLVSLAIVCIIYNASRGGAVSCVIMVLVFLFLSNTKKSFWKMLLITGSIITSVLFFFQDDLFTVINARLSADSSAGEDSRWTIWKSAFTLFLYTSFLGAGLGGLPEGMKLFTKNGIIVPHNFMLEILVQFGIYIFLFICAHLIRFVLGIRKIEDANIRVLLYIAFCALPFYGIIDSRYLLQSHFYAFFSSLLVFLNYKQLQLYQD